MEKVGVYLIVPPMSLRAALVYLELPGACYPALDLSQLRIFRADYSSYCVQCHHG